jgi:hypothetical protein
MLGILARLVIDLCWEKNERYVGCAYVFAPDLLQAIFDKAYGRDRKRDPEYWHPPTCDEYARKTLLLVDDLDRLADMTSEEGGERSLARVDAFLEGRYAEKKATVITANAKAADIAGWPGFERAVDRFRECLTVLQIAAPSQRGETQ